MIPETIAHYRIVSKLGEGGMGEVYRATDTKLGRDVAVKILPEIFAQDADRMARFQREAQVLASLNHPNIAAIYGVEDRAIVMELVEGSALAGPMSVENALPFIHQLIDALEYAHEKGVIHRDLKPANIKITPDGRLKVLDFGLAKALSTDTATVDPTSSPTLTMRATMAGVIMGTAAYMAPEQARGQMVDQRADIWSFGVVIYEMLTGRQLFGGPTVSDTLAAVLKEEPHWDAVSPRLRKLVRSCLIKDARQRVQDIGDARLLLDELPATRPAAQIRGVPRWAAAGLAALALAGLSIGIVHFREKGPESAPVTRFQIPMTGPVSRLALSPDGRRLAFIASDLEGHSALWLRPLDSLETRRLTPTDSITALFWSPDSRWIGFIADSKLKKIEASGGPAQTLCNVIGSVTGGAWSPNGVILYGALPNGGGLFRVSDTGGDPAPVTTADASKGETAHTWPQFLPDGRHFIYLAYNPSGERTGIYLGSLETKDRKHLMDSHFNTIFSPASSPGGKDHVLFLRDTTLMARAWDPVALDFEGDAFPLAEQVGSTRNYGFFTASATGVLVYRSGSAQSGNRNLAWFDHTGKLLNTMGTASSYGDLALSPDGKEVVVSDTRQSGKFDLWLTDARGMSRRFTSDPSANVQPVWSPDGKWIAFASARSGSAGIYMKDAGGVEEDKLILKSDRPLLPSSFSPDGRLLLYAINTVQGRFDVWILPMDGEHKPVPFLQSTFNEHMASFSPNVGGQLWIAYSSDDSGRNEVFVESYPRGKGKHLISKDGGIEARWRPDGKEIYYLTPDGTLMAVDVKMSPTFEAGVPRPLFQSHIYLASGPLGPAGFRYAVSADGRRFLMCTNVQASEPTSAMTVVLNWPSGNGR